MDAYTRSTSDTWSLKVVKIRRPAGGRKDRVPKARLWRGLRRENPARWTTLQVKYQGGGSGWVLVQARGRTVAYPADKWLLDVLLEVCNAK